MNFFAIFAGVIWFNDAYAYLDPGAGSLILQSAFAGIAAGIFMIKSYWSNLKAMFFAKKNKIDVENVK